MLTAAPPLLLDPELSKPASAFVRWLRRHKGSVLMAGLLAFAGPLTFFTGALSVMRTPAQGEITQLGLWWSLYGVSLWGSLLFAGYGCERFVARFGPQLRCVLWFAAACATAALPNIVTAGRATLLIDQGLTHSATTMHLHGFILSLIMALLYFAHLRRSRQHQHAAARLAAAQTAQRHAQRRIVQARLQELQARIDPEVLFDMLDAMRRLYKRDAAQAERFLDELIVFLRAALPRLKTASSSLAREAELARAFVRLHTLADQAAFDMTVDIAADVMHARFPPGVLLPLLDTAVNRRAGVIRLTAARVDDQCRTRLTLAALPSSASIERVRHLLRELYETSTTLEVEKTTDEIDIIVRIPYELA